MASLIVNVWVGNQGWGPGYGNADHVPAEVAAEIDDPSVWDEAPVSSQAPAEAPQERTEADARADHPSARKVTDRAEDKNASNQSGGSWSPPAEDEDERLLSLAALPDDKGDLIAFRDLYELDVDGRLGTDKLRTALEEAIKADT